MDTTPKLADGPSSAFAVPQRLFAGRKRRSEAAIDPDSSPFFTADEFAAFSVRGDVHESRLYGEFEAKRRTIVSPETPDSGRKSSAAVQVKKQTKHLMLLLVEAIEANRIQRPEKMLELDNARRRVSGIPVAQHERYLQLQRKLFQAQQRGLPEVLALSADEAKQWGQMKADVEMEQVGFCRMMARSLAAEAAANEMQIPAFALSWYEAMLTQCWNDIYRLYPRWFEPCVVVQLPSGGTLSGTGSAAIKAKEVAARGSCCAIDPRKLTPGQPLKTASDESGGVALEVVSPRQVISADLEAEELMEKYDCDLAISSSTLVSLFDSDTSTRFAHVPTGWGIPMKSRAIIHGGASKKRIFLDRPLPGNRPTTREKVAEAGRATLLSRFETESVVQGSTGGRTAYHIWQLDDKRVLVRSTTQASMITTASSAESTHEQQPRKHSIAPLSVFVKPDYNALGVEEQLTTSERCRFWLHSWLRGGSTVLVARVNPKKNIITSWTTYSPASLIYGDKNQQTLPLESFDPASKFQWLSTLFTALSDIPVGNYLLRPHDANGSSTFGKRRGGAEVLMATAEPGIETPAIDLYGFMPRRTNGAAAAVLPMSDAMPPAYSVLPSWNLRDRIPYTFQTGMYCAPFFLEGQCPQISRGESCEHIHLRLLERVAGSKAPGKARRWKFDNYTKVLKKAARANFEMLNRPVPVTLNYAFCGEENAPPSDPTAADLYAHMRCPKPPGECQLPHFTLHQILERLADDLLRKGRGKRREQKSGNRQQHQRAGRSSHGAQDD
ncbi:hypothetical protein PF005_g11683 [Phytophthora fragariae]|uniref:Little elongation complex subunit 2 C-terminal domain-containing protein n=1 Tax=Phytophthora fragariae TaxID=53985 RepID=A0A6A3TYR3_9STRA|nr:hypothetical protein PF003_g9735 [Phytophthora fragariae]KAE8937152.1 hypothetical protein PF009_g12946 [Phytophthora fragariae]KAE9109674.1 hypothetical protein PF010_g11447 [Phytophthora fragariae]KAE9110177.1 hypothetical protein PF007_g11951 [Phytophthora fragariae]KAE9144089.1 hypothetical protein PF006_g10934 [Phytophthora fragariae]